MIPSDTRSGASVDVGQVLDTGPWSMVQKMAVFLAALSIVLDGFDSQLIGFAIPVMIKEWGSRGANSPPPLPPASSVWVLEACWPAISPTASADAWPSSAASFF